MAGTQRSTLVLTALVVLVLGSIVFLALNETPDTLPVSEETRDTPAEETQTADLQPPPASPGSPATETTPDRSAKPPARPAEPATAPRPAPTDPLAIHGTVTDTEGRPLAGAVVARLAWWSPAHPEPVKLDERVTDDRGGYVFERVTTQCLLEVHAPGVCVERRPTRPGSREDFILGPGGRFVGRVHDEDGTAVPRAIVALTPDTPEGKTTWKAVHRLASSAETRTDKTGGFDLGWLPPCRYRVRVHPVDRTALARDDMLVQIRAGEVVRRDYTVTRGCEVSGRVVRKDKNTPIHGVRVSLSEGFMGRNGPVGGLGHQAVTDLDGRFRIRGVPPGTNSIHARAHGLSHEDLVFETTLQGTHEIEIRMEPCPVVRGRVTGPDGDAIDGARVSTSESGLRYFSDRMVVTDENGHFTLPISIPSKRVQVHTVAAGFPMGHSDKLVIEPGREAWVDIQLCRGGTLCGTVVDEGGQAVAHARLELKSGTNSSIEGYARSDESGCFTLSAVPEGRYDLRVKCQTRVADDQFLDRTVENVVVQPGEETRLQVCVSRGTHIAGQVTREDGAPLAGAVVNAWRTGRLRDPGGRTTVTDESGRFRIQGLTSGAPVDVRVVTSTRFGTASVKSVAPPVDGLLIRVPRLYVKLTGLVVRDTDGQPVTPFVVHASGPPTKGSHTPRQRSHEYGHADGRFDMDLSLGEWTLHTTTRDGFRSRPVTVLCHRDSSEPHVTLRLVRGASLEGRVVDPQGQPVSRAAVRIVEGSDPKTNAGLIRHLTDSVGHWRAQGLAESEHWIVAYHPDWCPSEIVRATAGAGSGTPIPLRLRTFGSCTVRIQPRPGPRDARFEVTLHRTRDGQESPHVRRLYRHKKVHRTGTTDPQGAVTFTRMIPGRYVVEVRQGDRSRNATVSIPEGECAVVEIGF